MICVSQWQGIGVAMTNGCANWRNIFLGWNIFLIFAAINDENWFGFKNKWKTSTKLKLQRRKANCLGIYKFNVLWYMNDLWNMLEEGGMILFARDLILRYNVLWCTTHWSMKHALQLASIILFVKEVTSSHEECITVGWQIAMSI